MHTVALGVALPALVVVRVDCDERVFAISNPRFCCSMSGPWFYDPVDPDTVVLRNAIASVLAKSPSSIE